MSKEEQLATALVAAVGGPANVVGVEHCVTRLRFVLRDPSLARPHEAEALAGVVSVVQRAGQFQVVVGNEVADTYRAIEVMPGIVTTEDPSLAPRPARGSLAARALDLLVGTFQPLLWALVGSSLIKTALAVAVQLDWVTEGSPVHAVWAAAGNAAFYFLPVLVGISASRKLGANPFVGGAIGAALLEDSYTQIGPTGTEVSFLGVPLLVVDYGQSVFPALLAAVMLAWLERWLRRRVPKDLRLIVVPTVCLAVLVPLTLVLFGPIGTTVSTALSEAVGWIWGLSPALAGAVMGGLWQVFVMFGVHWGFVPVIVNDLTVHGHSVITGPLVSAVLAQGAATAAVFLRTRNSELRSLAGAAAVSAFVAGVTEPAIYGVTLRLRRPFVYACVAGAVGGSIAAVGRSAADSFVFPGLLTLPAYLHVGSFAMQAIGTTVAVVLAFTLTWFVGFTDDVTPGTGPVGPAATGTDATTAAGDERAGESTAPSDEQGSRPTGGPATQPGSWAAEGSGHASGSGSGAADAVLARHDVIVAAPLTGEVQPLGSVADPVFARGLLGPGVAIRPVDGWLRSPVAGTVTSVARTRHAVGVTSDEGVDVLVHVGLDTVTSGGEGFAVAVATGDRVSVGQVLLHVDLPTLVRDGWDPTSPVVVTNAARFAGVDVLARGPVGTGEPLLVVRTEAERSSEGPA